MSAKQTVGPKDVFMQLFTIILLYICMFNFGVVLFQFINLLLPDVLSYNTADSIKSTLRWSLAILVIAYPCYVWLTHLLENDLKKFPAKRDLTIRKWLLYFTLFIAAIVIIGDLITLVYQFLNGGLSLQFILKVLAVFLIAGSVFLYYGWIVRTEKPVRSNSSMLLFVRVILAVSTLAIVAGFFMVGSPFMQRQKQFDERRTSDLSSIQWQIINYWHSKGQLPNELLSLQDDIAGFVPPVDPETGEPYDYTKTGSTSFTLCATFSLASEGSLQVKTPRDSYNIENSWEHDAGKDCFDRTIDPDLYPIYKNP